MYGYEPKSLGYPDNLSISSTETATQNHTSVVSAQHLFKMNSAFMPDDPARLNAGYGAVDPTGANNALLDQHHVHAQTHHQQQQQQQAHIQQPVARFSSGSESRNQTPAVKRTRDDEESDGNESESNSRGPSGENGVIEKRAGRRKIKIEYIEDKSRRHITFSKRKAGIMKKAFELSTLTGTQVLLLVVSETGLVYTFTTPKLQPIVTQPEGKNLIQACLNVPDAPGDRILQPVPTESNSYMSQPRQSQSHAYANANSAATAAAVAAAAAASNAAAAIGNSGIAAAHDLHQGIAEDRKLNDGSPSIPANAAPASYLQYSYGQSAVAQAAAAAAVAAASAGTPGGYASSMVPQPTNGSMAYAGVPGYTSYPGSTSQSQHHSPIAGTVSHTPHSAGGNAANGNGISAAVAAAASTIPGMGSLASYHHGYGSTQHQQHQQQHQQHGQYAYQQPHSAHAYHSHHQHSQHQHQPQGSAPGTPLEANPTASAAAVAAAVAAAAGTHQPNGANGMSNSMQAPNSITTSYLAANHYWSPSAIASPHSAQQTPQQTPTAPSLMQRTSYASGN
ncbi:transcription factor of the MADS box [Coemansia sp. Benny D115]|nr:transcription factor of the MADS box [Coemansia sp. Benny D115]